MLGARTEATLKTIADELDASGGRVGYAVCDITKDDDCAALVAAALSRFGRVDALVNCAALDTVFGGLGAAGDFADWRGPFRGQNLGSLPMARAGPGALRLRGLAGHVRRQHLRLAADDTGCAGRLARQRRRRRVRQLTDAAPSAATGAADGLCRVEERADGGHAPLGAGGRAGWCAGERGDPELDVGSARRRLCQHDGQATGRRT